MNMKTFFTKAAAVAVSGGLLVSAGFLAAKAVERSSVINGRFALGYESTDSVFIQASTNDISFTISNQTSGAKDNFFDKYAHNATITNVVAPGDTRRGKVTLKNTGTKNIKVYLYAKSTDDDAAYAKFLGDLLKASGNKDKLSYSYEKNGTATTVYRDVNDKNLTIAGEAYTVDGLKKLSKELVSNYITLTISQDKRDESGNVVNDAQGNAEQVPIYNGKLDGSDDIDSSFPTDPDPDHVDSVTPASGGKMTDLDAIYLGRLTAGDSTDFNFKLTIPTTIDNKYRSAVAMIDWIFVAKADDPPTPTPSTPTTPTTPTPPPEPEEPPPPQTGEGTIPYAVASMVCAMSAVMIFALAFRTKRRDNQAA